MLGYIGITGNNMETHYLLAGLALEHACTFGCLSKGLDFDFHRLLFADKGAERFELLCVFNRL